MVDSFQCDWLSNLIGLHSIRGQKKKKLAHSSVDDLKCWLARSASLKVCSHLILQGTEPFQHSQKPPPHFTGPLSTTLMFRLSAPVKAHRNQQEVSFELKKHSMTSCR